MTSLNNVYENKELFYCCNCCGDINMPHSHPLSYHDSDELPIKERNLYENYWCEGMGCHMYVVNYKGNPAMALGYLFDESYLCDLLNKDEASKEDMEMFYGAVSDYARMLENKSEVSFCEILIGKDTDPIGHELIVIVPYEKRSKINEIANYLDGVVYNTVEQLL